MSTKSVTWIKAAGVRAVKTVAQTAVATIGTSMAMGDQGGRIMSKVQAFIDGRQTA